MQNTKDQHDTAIQLFIFDLIWDFKGTQLQQLFNHSEIQERPYSKTSLIQTVWDILARFNEQPTNHYATIRLAFFTNAIIILSDPITKQLC